MDRRTILLARIKFLIPDLLTGINICIGFVCIILVMQVPPVTGAFHHNHIVSAWLIVVAGVIDGLDGAIAKRIGKTGAFGTEFDSLADLTVFAVAPSTLLYAFFYQGRSIFFAIAPLLYLIASAYRLARFNTTAPQKSEKQFVGLPTTGSAVIVVAVVPLVANLHRLGIIQEPSWSLIGVATGLVLVNSLLMVSTIEFDALDVFCLRKNNRIILPLLTVTALLLLLRLGSPAASLLMLGLYYVAESLGRWLLRTRSAQTTNKS